MTTIAAYYNIKIIGQLPGGIIKKKDITQKIGGYLARTGTSGGSGFWTVKNNFFSEVGYLNVKDLVGHNKKHDQNYWKKLATINKGQDYILGLNIKLVVHTGAIAGSICNTLTRNNGQYNKNVPELIKFDNFLEKIKSNESMARDW